MKQLHVRSPYLQILLLLCAANAWSLWAARPTVLDRSFEADLTAFRGDTFAIRALVAQPNGKLLMAGGWTNPVIARLNANGSVDPTFNFDPSFGRASEEAEYSTFTSLVLQPDGRILAWELANNQRATFQRIARFNLDGSLDPGFRIVFLVSSTDYLPQSLDLLADNRVFISGSFMAVNGSARPGAALLHLDGSLDTQMDFTGFDGQVHCAAVGSEGKLLVGGNFRSVGTFPQARLVRLNPDGAIDRTFTPDLRALAGLTNVTHIRVQPGGQPLLVGRIPGRDVGLERSVLVRLSAEGTLDSTFTSANELLDRRVESLHVESGRIVVGSYGTRFGRHAYRLYSLNVDGSLQLDLTAGIESRGGYLPGPVAMTPDGNLVARAFFPFAVGWSVLKSFTDESVPAVEFERDIYSASEIDAAKEMAVVRTGDISGSLSVHVRATGAIGNGVAAVDGLDFVAQGGRIDFAPGEERKVFSIPILDDALVEGLEEVSLTLSDPSDGAVLGFYPTAALQIEDNETASSSGASQGVRFLSETLDVGEDAREAVITVLRTGSSSARLGFEFSTLDGTAKGGMDFAPRLGTIEFAPLQTLGTVAISLYDDLFASPPRQFEIVLRNIPQGVTIETPRSATVRVHDNDRPGSIDFSFDPKPQVEASTSGVGTFAVQDDGKILVTGVFVGRSGPLVSLERLNESGSLDEEFDVIVPANQAWGAWSSVTVVLPQRDGKIMIGGDFKRVDARDRDGLARLSADGTLDETFHPGEIWDRVDALIVQPDGKVVIGGNPLNTVQGNTRHGIARLEPNGALDPEFQPPFAEHSYVHAMLLHADGKLLVAGNLQFRGKNGNETTGIARLQSDGTLDPAFVQNSAGSQATVYALAEQRDGKILVLGDSGLVRLHSDGAKDGSFNSKVRPGLSPRALAVQDDGRILIGIFDPDAGGAGSASKILRLNPDGGLDPSFEPPSRIDANLGRQTSLAAIQILPDGKLLIAGTFDTFSGVPRAGLVRLHGDPRLRLFDARRTSGGLFDFAFNGLPGRAFVLEASTDLKSWHSVATNLVTGFSPRATNQSPALDRSFYRAWEAPK